MKPIWTIVAFGIIAWTQLKAQTIATFQTSVGEIEVELFDDKPITTANFIKYAGSLGVTNTFIHRWVTNFIFQGGGYYVKKVNGTNQLNTVIKSGPIVNEYNVGRKVSNTYGTLAMAKVGGNPDSATSEWFFNLNDSNAVGNAQLDTQNGGFTVFGKTLSGQNVLNKFIPPPPSHGIYKYNGGGAFTDLPLLKANPASLEELLDEVIYVNLKFRREMGVKLNFLRNGARQISFNSIPGTTNVIQWSTNFPPVWQTLTNIVANSTVSFGFNRDPKMPQEFYRVRIDY